MLSRRKKQNLLYLGTGVLIGIAIAALITYFGIIFSFTKESIVKIYNVFPTADTTMRSAKDLVLHKDKQLSKQPQSTSDTVTLLDEIKTTAIETDTNLSEELTITVKTDMKIAEALIPITSIVKDTTTETKSIIQKGELLVEQWENPTNFSGYRKTQNKLIVYGIDIGDIELQLIEDDLYLIYHDKKLLLKDTENFLHYPSEFIK
jgi:hypothetical protein